MERKRVCVSGGFCKRCCHYATVRKGSEPYQGAFWWVYCKQTGKEKFVGYVRSNLDCEAPKTCPLLAEEHMQFTEKTFWDKVKEFFRK